MSETGLGPECMWTYSDLFQSDLTEITVALGYMDTGMGDLVNEAMVESITEQLTTSGNLCRQSRHPFSCGFTQDPSHPLFFTKTIFSPDGLPKRVRVKIVSAYAQDLLQKQASADAEKSFLESLSDPIVIYMGHSRGGGGPDFNPPRLLKNGERDYAWYRRNQPGFRAIVKALSHSRIQPKLMVILSCDSGKHFAGDLQKVAPETGLVVSSDEVEFSEQEHSLYGVIDGLLGLRCHDDFVNDIQSVDLSTGKNPSGILTLIGFFKN